MFSTLKKAFAAFILISAGLAAYAVPAKPGLLTRTQPDGSEINVRLLGDEFHHYFLSEDGYYIVEDAGFFYYADVDASGRTVKSDIKVTPVAARSAEAAAFLSGVDMQRVNSLMQTTAEARQSRMAQTARCTAPAFAPAASSAAMRGPGLFPGTHFPVMGKQKGLVILVEYQDIKMTISNPYDYFNNMLNLEGFSENGGTGSAVDFYREASMGQFDPEFDVYGPVTLANNRSYYGGNDWSGNDQNPGMMVVEAIEQLDAEVDFSQYDRDGDGYVDNVFIFYAGQGEASYGPASSVWPHAWVLEYAVGYNPVHDGVRFSRYACSNEYERNGPDGVGTFIHEFSHVMGLPDLYATSYTSAFTPGSWSCMDYGPYNNNGRTPPTYGAFERYALGWMEPMEISGPLNATLPVITTNKAGIVKTPSANEFFLFENRQQSGWDKYIPGHGMLVWHIDYNESVWDQNTVNNSASHQYVDIEEADGTKSENSRAGDAFPGTSHVTSFTDNTNPSMKTWSNQALGKPITDISEVMGVIHFKACGGREEALAAPVALEAQDCVDDSFTAVWQPSDEAGSYLLSVYTYSDSEIEYLEGYDHLNVGTATSHTVEGLEPDNVYFYTVAVSTGWETSGESNEISVSTGPIPFTKMTPVVLEAINVDDTSFTAAWEPVEQADGYLLTVYTKELTGTYKSTCDFSDGVTNLPPGWTSNSVASYANEAFSGEAIPAIRLGKTTDAVVSPRVADEISAVTFWHRGNGTGNFDRLVVSAYTDKGWTTVQEVPVFTEVGGIITTVDVNLPDVHQVRIEFRRFSGQGAVAVDDITICYGILAEPSVLAEYDRLEVGNVTEYDVVGLSPATAYYYSIIATYGSDCSRSSAEMEVTTHSAETSIIAVEAPGGALSVNGLTVTAGNLPITAYDITGRRIAAGLAVTLPARGTYIITTPSATHKIIL